MSGQRFGKGCKLRNVVANRTDKPMNLVGIGDQVLVEGNGFARTLGDLARCNALLTYGRGNNRRNLLHLA